MRIILSSIVFTLFFSQQVFAQNFEGTLAYKVSQEVLPSLLKYGITKEQLVQKMKEDGSFFDTNYIAYHNGFFRNIKNDSKRTTNIYRSDSNKIYTFQDSSDLCRVLDASYDLEASMTHKDPEITILDTTVVIYNKNCKVVHVKWNTGYFDYYYSEGFLPMDPEEYKTDTYNVWYKYLKIAKCLPIQITSVVNNTLVITYTLVSFKSEQISPTAFNIPHLILPADKLPAAPNEVIMKIDSKK